MRYHFDKPNVYTSQYGEVYTCNHPLYWRCTLFKVHERGLAVIQQRHDEIKKHTWWDMIDDCLTDAIYLHPEFWEFFDKWADEPDKDGLYPTITVRQLMWALRMKPMKKEKWETVFDHKNL